MAENTTVGHTPGPWAWFGNAGSNSLYLATTHSGRRYVMGFKRWGFSGGQPQFQPEGRGLVDASKLLTFDVGDRDVRGVDQAKANSSVYRLDINGIDCADARLIAAAPEGAASLPAVCGRCGRKTSRRPPQSQPSRGGGGMSTIPEGCPACGALPIDWTCGANPHSFLGTPKYLVWSNEHKAWWGPERRGYTRFIVNAGRYDRDEAMTIAGTRDGGWRLNKGNPDEIAIPEQDAIDQYADITRAQSEEPRP